MELHVEDLGTMQAWEVLILVGQEGVVLPARAEQTPQESAALQNGYLFAAGTLGVPGTDEEYVAFALAICDWMDQGVPYDGAALGAASLDVPIVGLEGAAVRELASGGPMFVCPEWRVTAEEDYAEFVAGRS
ncbi:hypothetical protein [Occultella kanbiaonis]|uniref:hypothetical protein n=1 Tax=Occultella kanbiaonis TaxID=2675754 RepID=UPI0013D54FF4|nr:hypothetical protein [Occultella kanbiaonis]